jgi:DnaJ-class molecular chaperone
MRKQKSIMGKLKPNNLKKKICDNCHGNGYVRVAVGNTSIDFRDNSQVHQCWVCDSEGEVYEERTDLIDDNPFSNKLH